MPLRGAAATRLAEFRMTSYNPLKGPFYPREHATDKIIATGVTCLNFSVTGEIILKLNSLLCLKMG